MQAYAPNEIKWDELTEKTKWYEMIECMKVVQVLVDENLFLNNGENQTNSGASWQKYTAFFDKSAKIGTFEGHVLLINLRPRDISSDTAFVSNSTQIQDGGPNCEKALI
jgi:hypothetical protein